MRGVSLLIAFAAVMACVAATYNCDHQTSIYYPTFKPLFEGSGDLEVTPFFSPDYDVQVQVEIVENAKESIYVGNPSWKSWIPCGNSYEAGCSPYVLRNEATDPLWVALLNAINRGVDVKYLGSYCGTHATEDGLILPETFLAAMGKTGASVEARSYTSTSFYHAKIIVADGKVAAVSSINLSKSSMTGNREAGMVFNSDDANDEGVAQYVAKVFEADWEAATAWPITETYTSDEWDTIGDSSYIPMPSLDLNASCTYSPPKPQTFSVDPSETVVWAQPDYAWETYLHFFNKTQDTFDLYIYVVNSWTQCNAIADLYKRGVDVKLLVSKNLVGSFPTAEACYKSLTEMGLTVRQTDGSCDFAHQKYVLLDRDSDDGIVLLSTGNYDDYDLPPSTWDGGYPPATWSDGIQTYRGYTVGVANSDVVSVFYDVFKNDYENGEDWYPPSE